MIALALTFTIVVYQPWAQQGIVNAASYSFPGRTVILISPLLVEDLYGEGVPGVLAHELAHTYIRCDPKLLGPRALQSCEMRTDALAASWVGRRTVRIGLCQLLFSAWNRRAVTDVSDLMERIHALHQDPR